MIHKCKESKTENIFIIINNQKRMILIPYNLSKI